MQKSKFSSWFAKEGRTTAPSIARAKLALESLGVRVLPSVAGGACIAPPICPPVACDVSHAEPACKDKVEHGATARGDQHSVCLFGVEVGKGHEQSSHGKADQGKPPKPTDACSKSDGEKQKSSHGKVDQCKPPKPVECPVPVPPTPCPPPPPVVCLPPAPPRPPCPVPVPPPATCPPPADACSKSHGGNPKSSHGESSHGTVDLCSKSHGGNQKSSHGQSSHGHVDLCSETHGGDQKSSHTKTSHTKSSHGNCYDDGYAMPGRASDLVHALCGV